jgi:hypothetical protein
MVGTAIVVVSYIGRPRRVEEEPEGLLDAPGAISMTDVGGED